MTFNIDLWKGFGETFDLCDELELMYQSYLFSYPKARVETMLGLEVTRGWFRWQLDKSAVNRGL